LAIHWVASCFVQHSQRFRSELEALINEHVARHNNDPKSFIWIKSARDSLQ
jgi:hypothetical protein